MESQKEKTIRENLELGVIVNIENSEGESIYLNNCSGGQHKEEIKNFKNLWVDKKDLEEVYNLWDTQHLKENTDDSIKIMKNFFEKYKKYCSDQEALLKYLEDTDNK